MIRVEKFEAWHMTLLQEREGIYDAEPGIKNDIARRCDDRGSVIYTFIMGEHYLAVMGLSLIWPGVGEVWGVLSEKVKMRPLEFHKRVKGLLDLHAEKLNIHRLSTTVRADYEMGLRWARSCGFYEEGRMKQFGADKTDYFLLARIF